MRKLILSMFFLVILPVLLLGQGRFKVKGKITDAKLGEPLIGASVILKPLNLGAMADINGDYSFDVPTTLAKGQSVELTASYVNYREEICQICFCLDPTSLRTFLWKKIFLTCRLWSLQAWAHKLKNKNSALLLGVYLRKQSLLAKHLMLFRQSRKSC